MAKSAFKNAAIASARRKSYTFKASIRSMCAKAAASGEAAPNSKKSSNIPYLSSPRILRIISKTSSAVFTSPILKFRARARSGNGSAARSTFPDAVIGSESSVVIAFIVGVAILGTPRARHASMTRRDIASLFPRVRPRTTMYSATSPPMSHPSSQSPSSFHSPSSIARKNFATARSTPSTLLAAASTSLKLTRSPNTFTMSSLRP